MLCLKPQPVLITTTLYDFSRSPLPKGGKNGEATGFGVRAVRKDVPDSVRSIHPDLAKGSGNQETSASDLTFSLRPLSLDLWCLGLTDRVRD